MACRDGNKEKKEDPESRNFSKLKHKVSIGRRVLRSNSTFYNGRLRESNHVSGAKSVNSMLPRLSIIRRADMMVVA